MGHQFTIEGDEAFALATELAELRGKSLQSVVLDALREKVDAKRKLKDKVARVMALAAKFRASLTGPLPTSADINLLYDDKTGLPV